MNLKNISDKNIEEYKQLVINTFMIKSTEKIIEEFKTDRICWAFVMWTYRILGIFVKPEDSLKELAKDFKRVKESDLPYRFPDIVIFKSKSMLLGRHAGITLDRKRFVHLAKCDGAQFTELTRLPWSAIDKIVIRHNAISNS